jgi:hypothetical protein
MSDFHPISAHSSAKMSPDRAMAFFSSHSEIASIRGRMLQIVVDMGVMAYATAKREFHKL